MFTNGIFTDTENRFFVYREIPKNNIYRSEQEEILTTFNPL